MAGAQTPGPLDLGSAPGSEHLRTLALARELWRASRSGRPVPRLLNRNIGLVARDDGAEAASLRQAATELGAHVAIVRAGLTDESSASDVAQTARILGRLYDAVVLQGQPVGVVARLKQAAAVPVLDGVGGAMHPAAGLAAEIDPSVPADEGRRYVVQALLLEAIG